MFKVFFSCGAYLSHKDLVGRFHSSKKNDLGVCIWPHFLFPKDYHHLAENQVHQGVSQEPLRFYEEVIKPLGLTFQRRFFHPVPIGSH